MASESSSPCTASMHSLSHLPSSPSVGVAPLRYGAARSLFLWCLPRSMRALPSGHGVSRRQTRLPPGSELCPSVATQGASVRPPAASRAHANDVDERALGLCAWPTASADARRRVVAPASPAQGSMCLGMPDGADAFLALRFACCLARLLMAAGTPVCVQESPMWERCPTTKLVGVLGVATMRAKDELRSSSSVFVGCSPMCEL